MFRIVAPAEDDDGRENAEPEVSLSSQMSEALGELTGAVVGAAKEVGAAAERFLARLAAAVEAAAQQSRQSAGLSSEMAAAAARAAGEAKTALETAREIGEGIGERVREEVRQAIDAALAEVRAAGAAQERAGAEARRALEEQALRLQAEVQQRMEETVTRVELSARASEEAAAAAQRAVEEARQQAERSGAALTPGLSAVDDLLQRLERDYELLADLVRELHDRISGMAPTPVGEMARTVAPQGAGQFAAQEPGQPAVYEPGEAAMAPSPAPGGPAPEGAEAAAQLPEEENGQKVSGTIMVSIAPVSDFEHLLNLDGALGRMADVGNVSLADYANEEVRFRVDVTSPMSVREFVQTLAACAGVAMELVSAGPGAISLRAA